MRIAIFTLLLLLWSATGVAAELPDHYPEKVLHQGTLNTLDKNRRALVIGDTLLFFNPETYLFRPDGITASFNDLRIGKRVGCNYAREGDRLVIRELWILPTGASFAN